MECKCLTPAFCASIISVLIETYWNVNIRKTVKGTIDHPCLNRNILECKYSLIKYSHITSCGLNRNILECKYESGTGIMIVIPGLNRNILECKWYAACFITLLLSSLNRNILECKFDRGCVVSHRIGVLIETYWNVN